MSKEEKENDYMISDSEEKDEKMLSKKTKRDEEDSEEEEEENDSEMIEEENEEEEPQQEEDKKQVEYSSETWNELFIKNLSYNTTKDKIKEYFSKYGEIEDIKIVVDKKTNRSKGVGFCRFKDPKSDAKAMNNKNKLNLDGRQLTISYSNERKQSAPKEREPREKNHKNNKQNNNNKFSVFVANLNFNSTEEGLRKFFKDCGKIVDIRIAKKSDGRIKGFAHVDFDSKKSVDLAMKKNNCRLDKRRLRIEITGQAPKGKKNKQSE